MLTTFQRTKGAAHLARLRRGPATPSRRLPCSAAAGSLPIKPKAYRWITVGRRGASLTEDLDELLDLGEGPLDDLVDCVWGEAQNVVHFVADSLLRLARIGAKA